MMKKILIVEDDADFQDIYTLYLQGESHEILRAMNGREGLDCLAKTVPDLIILDLIMPVMDGEEFYVALRSRSDWAGIPVIVASVNEKLPRKIQELGGLAGHLRKPFGIDTFLEKVNACLG
jgi:CheY-like chemotaxis protein